jgi:hypothetical protein
VARLCLCGDSLPTHARTQPRENATASRRSSGLGGSESSPDKPEGDLFRAATLARLLRGVRERLGRDRVPEVCRAPRTGSFIERSPGFQSGLRGRIDSKRACSSALRGSMRPFITSTPTKWSGPSRFPWGSASTSRVGRVVSVSAWA